MRVFPAVAETISSCRRVGFRRAPALPLLSFGMLLAAAPSAFAQQTPPPAAPLPVSTASGAAASPAAAPLTPALTNPLFHDPVTGVEISATLDDATFPLPWRGGSIAASATPADPAEAQRASRILQNALRKYPATLLQDALERIYIVGDLQFQGIHAAGTNSATRIYLKVEANNKLYTDAFIEESFHHEFAHMLRRNHGEVWDEPAWMQCNPPDFKYGAGSGVEAVKAGKTSLWLAEDWNKRGFISEYAASDLSEDFATVGGALFTGAPELWPTAEQYPLLLAKLRVAVDFYNRLDSSLNERFFRNLRPGLVPTAPSIVLMPEPTVKKASDTPPPGSPPPPPTTP